MAHFNYNGKLFSAGEKIIGPQNRGLRYGDGLFETIKLFKGSLVLFDDHMERLFTGMRLLHFKMPAFFTAEKIKTEILALAKKNNLTYARIRLNVFRGNGGLYDPESNAPEYIIESMPLPQTGILNENGLQLCIYTDAVKAADSLSFIKSNNGLIYIGGAYFAKENKCNDAVLLNQYGRICETTIANIFIIKDGILKTPPISEGCVAGIMRNWLIEKLREEKYEIEETAISTDELLQADEVFLSNAMYNMRRVSDIAGKVFSAEKTAGIYHTLQKKYPAIIC